MGSALTNGAEKFPGRAIPTRAEWQGVLAIPPHTTRRSPSVQRLAFPSFR